MLSVVGIAETVSDVDTFAFVDGAGTLWHVIDLQCRLPWPRTVAAVAGFFSALILPEETIWRALDV